MNALATVVVVVWLLGVVAFTVAPLVLRRHDPMLDAQFTAAPVLACLLSAVTAVGWPSALIAAGLIRLVDRRRR